MDQIEVGLKCLELLISANPQRRAEELIEEVAILQGYLLRCSPHKSQHDGNEHKE